jgi:ribonuclease D
VSEPDQVQEPPDVPVLREPTDGTPEPITTVAELAAAVAGLAAGTGPLAVDAERASGYRFSQRAYLVQLRRNGYGTVLIDPISLPDLSSLDVAMADVEWILHAAHQDLPCLAEVGLHPRRLFDTELAGRLLGEERVALGTMVESRLGIRLEKGHSAADWSTRPLPHDWLVYAALDVELLVALRDAMAAELAEAGKTELAEQEFEAARLAPPPPPRTDPWRRTSGIHAIRDRRRLAMVRALWTSRNDLAIERDVAPGRVLPDAAIIAAVKRNPTTVDELTQLPVFSGPRQRRQAGRWMGALVTGRELPDAELPPPVAVSSDWMPPATRWRERFPEAADRLAAARLAVSELADSHQVLAQNLLAGDQLRRLAWEPPAELTEQGVAERLLELGARPWQAELASGPIAAAMNVPPPAAVIETLDPVEELEA